MLTWLKSESCRYKVFVGTRVSEIQTLTDINKWRYVDTSNNPADDITRGTPLSYLCQETRWSRGPPFLVMPMNEWPNLPIPYSQEDCTEC